MLSGRTNDEVAAAPDALWQSGVAAAEAEVRLGAGASEPPTDDELAALDAIRRNGRWSVAGRDVKLTNLDKVLFPGRDGEPPVTKRELVRHYATVGPLLLPYLAGRPVNLHRYPEGVDRQGFWQQELPAGTPDWVTRWHDDDPGPDTAEWRVLVDGVPTLAWLANLAAVELHPWTGRLPEVRRPAWALIDIDPGTRTTFDQVLVLARLFRTALGHLGVEGMPKVTGQRGIQIWVPVAPGYTYSDTRGWVEKVSKAVGSTVPGAGQLGVDQGPARWAGAAGLHPERGQQDAGRAVERPAAGGGAGVGADHLGGARRPRPGAGPLDRPGRPGPRPGGGRPARPADRPRAETPFPLVATISAWKMARK